MQFIGSLSHGRQDPRRVLLAISALLLALLLLLTLLSLALAPLPESAAAAAGEAAGERQNAVAQWEALWADIGERGEAALQPEMADSSLRSAGDTVFMRYRNLWHAIDEAARQGFQLAALANAPQRKLALLQPLATGSAPLIRARALLEIARVQLRRRALNEAKLAAQEVLAIPGLLAGITADAYFILGYVALEMQDPDRAEAALAQAVELDPGFWDARQLQLLVLSRQIDQSRQSVAACLNRSRLMIRNLGALPALAQDRTQLRDIADRFATPSTVANPAFFLLSGLGYLWAGDRERAQAALTEASQTSGKLPRECAILIAARAEALLKPPSR